MEKQRWAESEKRRAEERRSVKSKRKRKEDAGARKGRKVAIHYVFPLICDSGGSKSRLAKAAGAEPAGQMRDYKVHAVVARSTFGSQNVQNTPGPDHFWKLRCGKSARRCGAKHLSKSSAQQKLRGSEHFWTFGCRFAWQAQGILHLAKSERNVKFCSNFNYNHHYTKLHYTPLQLQLQPQPQLHYTTLHSTTPQHTTLHYTTLATATATATTTTTLLYTTLHQSTLHYTTWHYTTPSTPPNCNHLPAGAISYTTPITNATAATLH